MASVYAPKDHPEGRIKVKEVLAAITHDEEDSDHLLTLISCCDPDDPTETVDVELLEDEWNELGLELAE